MPGRSAPPYSFGHDMPSQPRSASLRMNARFGGRVDGLRELLRVRVHHVGRRVLAEERLDLRLERALFRGKLEVHGGGRVAQARYSRGRVALRRTCAFALLLASHRGATGCFLGDRGDQRGAGPPRRARVRDALPLLRAALRGEPVQPHRRRARRQRRARRAVPEGRLPRRGRAVPDRSRCVPSASTTSTTRATASASASTRRSRT